jgi:hypothetical protein
LRNGNSRTTTTDRNTMNTADIARHLSLEPHDDEPDATPAERAVRAQLRTKYEAWRRDNPFDDILDWTLYVARTRLLQGIA